MPQMYARVFVQILDSSLADDWRVRHVFEDLLKLANMDGVVDMTRQAIARRTNVPIRVVSKAIEILEKPDKESRDEDHDGRRIIRLDNHRNWGWRILNWHKYEAIRLQRDMREFNAARMANYRAKKNDPPPHTPPPDPQPQPHPHPHPQGVDYNEATCSNNEATCSTTVESDEYKKRGIPRNESEAIAIGAIVGLAEDEARKFYNHFEAQGWVDRNGNPVLNAKAKMAVWKAELQQKQYQARVDIKKVWNPIDHQEDLEILRAKKLGLIP